MEMLVCPAMSVDDKYRTLYAALMGVFNDIAQYATSRLSPRQLQDLVNAAMHGVGWSAGKRLVRVYRLKPTVEDAMKLLLLLNNESLAYLPKLKQIYAELDGDVGYLTIRRDPWYDWYFKHLPINCEESCSQHEFTGLVSHLGGDFRIEVLESLPRGDERCRFRITMGR
ncbi:hypothetical protein [Candidatus Solincola sp.]|jgi:hypothetical protein|nr:hypothetical protein [Actinomycetota bacterium]MDI7252067.1 hypothetical protein [Actinomycetota bacterium]